MNKNITYSNRLARLTYRSSVALLSIIAHCIFNPGVAYAFLILGITAEAFFSFKRIISSLKMIYTRKARHNVGKTGSGTIYAILIWCLSVVLFYYMYIITEAIMPAVLACMLVTALLWILDWFFMFRNICIFRLIMKNKGCNNCRIYHFNYAMLSTPSLFIVALNPFSVIFIFIAFLHLLLGEICFRMNSYIRADTAGR